MDSNKTNIFAKFADNRIIRAIREGFIDVMPLIVVGSFAVLLINLPLTQFQDFMTDLLGDNWKNFSSQIERGTMQIMSISIMIAVSYNLAKEKIKKQKRKVHMATVILVSIGNLISLSNIDGDIKLENTGTMGIFLSVIIAIMSTELFFFFNDHKILKLYKSMNKVDSSMSRALTTIEPVVLTLAAVSLLGLLLKAIGMTDIHDAFYGTLRGLTENIPDEGIFGALTYVFYLSLFWFFGIHGTNVLQSTAITFLEKQFTNSQEIAAGNPAIYAITNTTLDVFVFAGGAGVTLCLIIALLIKARRSSTAGIAKLSIPLCLFNINETMIYGIPIVLNPFYFIPFILTPLVLTCTTYFAISSGLVPHVAKYVHWATPIFFSGYTSTGNDIRGILLQVFNLLIGTAIYIPFVKASERYVERQNVKLLHTLNKEVESVESRRVSVFVDSDSDFGALARTLVYDLQNSIENDKGLYLVLQPQVDSAGRLYGGEVLIRWHHEHYGFVPPNTLIKLSEEAGIDDRVNDWVIKQAMTAYKRICDAGFSDMILAINMSPFQAGNEETFEIFEKAIKEYGFNPAKIEIELTENFALNNATNIKEYLSKYKQLGVRLAIDNFGMGHTSLLYMQACDFDTVKINGSIVKGIAQSKNNDIVEGIIKLSKDKGMRVIAEAVESEEQRDALKSFNCNIYQGYYYSRPLQIDAFIQYVETLNKK